MDIQNVKGIAVYGTDCIADVSRGDDDNCTFVSAKEKYFNVQTDNNGLLTVTQKKGNIFYRIIMKRFEFKLILPKHFVGRLRFKNKNGGIYIKDGGFSDIELNTKNGKIEAENISCAEFTLKMNNGSVSLKNITAADGVSVKCDNGNIKTETIKAAAFSVSCRNVELSVADVKAQKIECSTRNGTIDASAVDAPDLRLDTSNGKINALCAGVRDDYRLSLETTHGAIAVDGVPSKNVTDVGANAKRRAVISTSNGDIDVKFNN